MATKKKPRSIQSYAFIDTNIFLDFYRSNNEANIALIDKLTQVSDRIICTYQIEMEFLKNRQETIIQAIKGLSADIDASIPAVVSDVQISSSIKKLKDEAKKKKQKVEKRVLAILENPRANDKIFCALEEIFNSNSAHVLTRDMKIRQKIKRLAWKRFILGYPPRKQKDTSIGDAVNWEWLVHCGSFLSGRFIVVSRDSDYGYEHSGKYFINDQLKREFRDRVGGKSLIYTRKLSDALKAFEIQVTKEEQKAEEADLYSIDTESDTKANQFSMQDNPPSPIMTNFKEDIQRRLREIIRKHIDDLNK